MSELPPMEFPPDPLPAQVRPPAPTQDPAYFRSPGAPRMPAPPPPGRARRRGPRRHPLLPIIAIMVWFSAIPIAFFGALVVPEALHRSDSAWTYQRVEFSDCNYLSRGRSTYQFRCDVATNPPSPTIAELRTNATSNSPDEGPGYGFRWVHRTGGIADRLARNHSLWISVVLLVPLAILLAAISSYREARRAGLGWGAYVASKQTSGRRGGRGRGGRRRAPAAPDSSTPTSF